MHTTKTTIHYKRHLIARQDFGKFKWRGKEFDTEEQAFKAIDDKISHFKNKNMEQNNFEWTDDLVSEYCLHHVLDKINQLEIPKTIEQFKASKTKPKEYEILEFSVDYLGESNIVFYKLTEPNVYRKKGTDFPIWFDILNTQKEKSFKIKRVRRLSDNAVFRLGDRFCNNYAGQYTGHIITEFKIHEDYLKVYIGDGLSHYPLYALQTINKPIFTTTDGKDIYEGDIYFVVLTKEGFGFEPYSYFSGKGNIEVANYQNDCKIFSTKEAAEEYINWNKKQFSLSDIMAYSEWYSGNDETEWRKFSTDFLKRQSKAK